MKTMEITREHTRATDGKVGTTTYTFTVHEDGAVTFETASTIGMNVKSRLMGEWMDGTRKGMGVTGNPNCIIPISREDYDRVIVWAHAEEIRDDIPATCSRCGKNYLTSNAANALFGADQIDQTPLCDECHSARVAKDHARTPKMSQESAQDKAYNLIARLNNPASRDCEITRRFSGMDSYGLNPDDPTDKIIADAIITAIQAGWGEEPCGTAQYGRIYTLFEFGLIDLDRLGHALMTRRNP